MGMIHTSSIENVEDWSSVKIVPREISHYMVYIPVSHDLTYSKVEMKEFYHVYYHVFIIFYCLQVEAEDHRVSQCCVHVYGVTYCTHVVGMMLCRGRLVT